MSVLLYWPASPPPPPVAGPVIDEMHRNYGTATGTIIPGALTDGNQALRLNSTDTLTIPDSPSSSLAIADGAAGGMAMTGWFSLPSIPGTTQTILGKVGSYELKVNSAGRLLWTLSNGASTVTVTSATTIAAGGWYHFAGVYNGDYTGTTIFGNQTPGSAFLSVPADYHMGSNQPSNLNLQLCKFTALEKGQITSVLVHLRRTPDTTLPQNVKAMVFGPNTSTQPGDFLGMSSETRYLSPNPSSAFASFTVSANFYAGDVWLGFFSGGSDGNSGQLEIGHETTGGTRAWKADSYPDPATPFGTPAGTDSKKFAAYANYTATGRTGAEGKALIYLNGVEDASSAYANGIADTSNALTHPAGVAVDLDDWAIWNKKLTPVQVATHFAAK